MKKYAKPFLWKFSITSHGKGVVDGVGGKVKSTVRRKVMSKRKDSLVVQDCESFVQAVKKLLKSASIIHIDRGAIEIYKESQPFNNVLAVKGIFKIHVIEVSGSETKLWRKCTFQKMALPDIHLKPKKASPETEREIVRLVEIEEGQINKPEKGLIPIPYQKMKEGMWVVIYEEEKWIRKVVTKCHDQVCVRCLEKSFGIHQPQLLEREEDSIYFSQAYHTDITPEQTQIDTNRRKGRKLASGSGTTICFLFALVFLVYFCFSLFLKLVISLLLKNLKSLSWSLCNLNSPDYQVSESCTPYTYLYMLYVSKLLNPLCIRHLRV